MEVENDLDVSSSENGEFSFGPKDMSLDVKLLFAKVCSRIDEETDLLPPAEAMYILKKIQREAKFIIQKVNNAAKDKLNETQHSTISGQTSLHQQEPKFSRAISNLSIHEPHNSSYFGDNSKLLHPSRTISEGKSFRPIKKQGLHDSVQFGSIPEEVLTLPLEDDSTEVTSTGSSSYQETLGENVNYLLKKWSIKKSNNDLFLTGVKMDRKGNVFEKDFISKKILSRPDKDVVRTEEGDFLLDEPLSDPKKALPEEIRVIFTKEKYFPKFWRKALTLWIELDQKAEKAKKKAEAKNKANSEPKPKKKSLPKSKDNTPAEGKKSTKGNKKDTPDTLRKNTQMATKKNTPKESTKNTPNDDRKTQVIKKKPTANKTTKNEKKPSETSVRQEKENQVLKKKTKMTEVNQNILKEDKLSRNPLSDSDDDEGPFHDENDDILSGLDTDSAFLLPKTSMTPTGLLNSIKKTTAKGRFTPPTEMFDNIYGQTHSSNSSIANSSFPHHTNKNDNVVKRMAKAKSSTKVQRVKEVGYENIDKAKSKENELVAEVLRAAALKTTTTPTLLREVFREDVTDESDVVDSD